LNDRHPGRGYDLEALLAADQTSAHHLRAERDVTWTTDDLTLAVADEETTLLEYWLTETGGYVWALTREGVRSFALPPSSTLEALTQRVLGAFSSRAGAARTEQAAAEFSRVMLGPVKGRLRKRILIVGNGPIAMLPFAALPDPEDPRFPLVKRHEIAHLPSVTSILTLRRRPRPARSIKDVAIFADPVFDPRDAGRRPSSGADERPALVLSAVRAVGIDTAQGVVPRLPFARVEAERIARIIPSQQFSLYLGVDANRQAFLQAGKGQYRIIHVSTHALANDRDPNLSGLVLSLVGRSGERVDGFFRLPEIYSSRLATELLVLSACETASGKQIKFDGVFGLTSGFLRAGAARVLSTSWKIDDEATADFMSVFYRVLFGPPRMTPAAALRATQLELSRSARWSMPYYWAGFVLEGDWRWQW